MATAIHDIVHAEIHLVQEASMEEVEELGLLVQETALCQEVLQRRPRKWRVGNRCWIMRIEDGLVFTKTAVRVVVASPKVVLQS